jgi:uncharacterized protein YfaS (alpha-2-macroglobulin family)
MTYGGGKSMDDLWRQFAAQVEAGTPNQAYETARTIFQQARQSKDDAQWTRALFEMARMKVGVYEFEKSLELFEPEDFPVSPASRGLLLLFHAQLLRQYYQYYRYDILQRKEKPESASFREWTSRQISQACEADFRQAWKIREAMGATALKTQGQFFSPGNFPENVRPTLRDFLVQSWADFLGDQETWSPEQAEQLHQLDSRKLIGTEFKGEMEASGDVGHPLERLAAIYTDLARWHDQAGQPEAALDARLRRVLAIQKAFDSPEVKAQAVKSLEALGQGSESLAWWSYLQYHTALLLESLEREKEAFQAADQGGKAHPGTLGGRLCDSLAARIQAPSFSLKTEFINPVKRGTLTITHRNLDRLYLRVYSISHRIVLPSFLPLVWEPNAIRNLLRNDQPQQAMEKVLTDRHDYRRQKDKLDLDFRKPGWYLVVASARKDFGLESNHIEHALAIASEISLIVRPAEGDGRSQVYCVQAGDGRPAGHVQIEVYQEDWDSVLRPLRLLNQGVTDSQGIFDLGKLASKDYRRLRILARQGENLCTDPEDLYTTPQVGEQPRNLYIFTDRAIYRPDQDVLFKVLAISASRPRRRYQVLANCSLKVRALDANGQVLAEWPLRTNAWGSASGHCKIPRGKLLGHYRLEAKDEGKWNQRGGDFQVEEYKLPKFTVTLDGPKSAMRLDQPAMLTGHADYYFGGPVKQGKVQYQIQRQPRYPVWFWWFRPLAGRVGVEPVARGTVASDAQGKFSIAFTPMAAGALSNEKDVSYQFAVSASVTDEAGDTISTSNDYPVGWVSLKAEISWEGGYPLAGHPFTLTARLTDLSGKARPGKAVLDIILLDPAPDRMPLAAQREDQLVITDPGPELAALPRGKRVHHFDLDHNAKGVAVINGVNLASGAYMLEYKGRDSFRQDVLARQFIQVAPAEGREADLPASLTLIPSAASVKAGQSARWLISSGIPNQTVYFELQRDGETIFRKLFRGLKARQFTFTVPENLRGGFTAKAFFVRDYRLYSQSVFMDVPWDNKDLKVELLRWRRVLLPGVRETITLKVKGPDARQAGAEVLATLCDQALDYYLKRQDQDPRSLLARDHTVEESFGNQFQMGAALDLVWYTLPSLEEPEGPRFLGLNYFAEGYGDGFSAGGRDRVLRAMAPPAACPANTLAESKTGCHAEAVPQRKVGMALPEPAQGNASAPASQPPVSLRKNFMETAFFEPHLLTDKNGEAAITFTAPDSVTAWNLTIFAHGKGMEVGTLAETIRTQKDFMVRPYLPRFLRENDRVEIKTAVDNKTSHSLTGEAFLKLENEQGEDVTTRFRPDKVKVSWKAKAENSTVVSFHLNVPSGTGLFKARIWARSGAWTDGEERILPLLPSRMHLLESRFTVLKGTVRKDLVLPGLKQAGQDPSLIHESLVVTLDGQLIYSVLKALPYLYYYPYECVEQTLNRFTSMAVLQGTFSQYPSLAALAKKFSARKTPLETWDAVDPNQKLALEESPWLGLGQGGMEDERFINTLDPRTVQAQARESLDKLARLQLPDGGFPWFGGGRPSLHMTLVVLTGLARAQAAGVEIPELLIIQALRYCLAHYQDDWQGKKADAKLDEADLSLCMYLNYVLSCFPQLRYAALVKAFDRKALLEVGIKQWQKLSPYGRAMLAMTLQRSGDTANANRVLNSLLDVARTTENEGTYWAPEPKAWLWYNDSIEMHAFILLAMLEVKPKDARVDGMALWLLRNKKGNQWKSTRASAEAMYALVQYMSRDHGLEAAQSIKVTVPPETRTMHWEPGVSQGKQQFVLDPGKITPQSGDITLEKTGPGYAFASATWQYSTEKLPLEASGDVLAVQRRYFGVKTKGRDQVLEPIADKSKIAIGDEIEVELTIQAKTPMEYVHLRDPRGAGFEPEERLSGYQWEQQLGYYEEIRDSATNFFFDWLPQGTYTFRYRIRAANEGIFRVGPATLQSLYAPEFGAHSSGHELAVEP